MEELKRCPFCGGEAKLMKMGYPHWVYCEDCGARVHGRVVGEVDGERASIEAWNRRAKNPKEQVQVLADLNGVERAEMARWLADHGQKVDGRLLPEPYKESENG